MKTPFFEMLKFAKAVGNGQQAVVIPFFASKILLPVKQTLSTIKTRITSASGGSGV
jgi:hypothetical protein